MADQTPSAHQPRAHSAGTPKLASESPKYLDSWFKRLAPRTAERRYALHKSREALSLYLRVQQERPDLRGRDLYREIVARRGQQTAGADDSVLDRSEQSFCTWPVPRELSFRDVVHYLVVTEYLRLKSGFGVQIDMGAVVARVIPRDW